MNTLQNSIHPLLQITNYKNGPWMLMVGSQANGCPLVKASTFGADMLRFGPFQKTCLHTHPGNHILFVVKGEGWLLFDGSLVGLTEGTCYFVPGKIKHQVGTDKSEMLLLSISDNHQPVDSPNRLEILE